MSEKTLVLDCSYWQGDLSRYWQLFKDKGVKAIIIQSSNGLAYQDYFHATAEEAKKQGFLVGSYHYYRQHIPSTSGAWITCDPKKQAMNYYNWVSKCPVAMDLPPALDFENGGNPQGVFYSGATSCLTTVENLFKRTPMIYSSPSILSGLAQASWGKYPLWLAHYTTEDRVLVPKFWDNYTLWQYTDKETYTPPGSTLKKPIDHNWFNGSYEDLLKFCEIGEAPEPNEPPDPNQPKQVITTVPLRGRATPVYIAGESALVFKRGQVLEVADKAEVYEEASGITWQPIILYVSKKYVREA